MDVKSLSSLLESKILFHSGQQQQEQHASGESLFNMLLLSHQFSSSQSSLGEMECISIGDEDTSDKDITMARPSTGKRVSWGDQVEIREYSIIEDDSAAGKCLALTLDWHHRAVETRSISESKERHTRYALPKRLSLEERRCKLLGDPQDNLVEFELVDAALDDMMRGMENLLLEHAPLPDFSRFHNICSPLSSNQHKTEKYDTVNISSISREPTIYWQRVAC